MRQLIALLPSGQGQKALRIAESHMGLNASVTESKGLEGTHDAVVMHIPNDQVGGVIAELQELAEARITLLPHGVIPLTPPISEAPEQTKDISSRSPLEIFLSGLQSIGSWKGFLGYAAFSGVVAWIGLYTNTIYLLVAAMLISPFAGPAMTLAMGTARGDGLLIRRSSLRYVVSLLLAMATAAACTVILGPDLPTELMVDTSLLSAVSFLLPLIAGGAGALVLCQSDRSSLVSAAGPGMLVAASLAPPSSMMGMAAILGRWDMVLNGAFLLLLQLVGINLAAALVFWRFGLTPDGVRLERGRNSLRVGSLALSGLGMAGLLLWQFAKSPDFEKSTTSKQIAHEVRQAIDESDLAKTIQARVEFTRANVEGQESALIQVYVQKKGHADVTEPELRSRLQKRIIDRVLAAGFNVTPLVSLDVLSGPRGSE